MTWSPEVCGMWGTWDFRNSCKTRAEKKCGTEFLNCLRSNRCWSCILIGLLRGAEKVKYFVLQLPKRCSKCGIVIKARHTPSQEIWTVVLQLRESVSLALQVFRCPQHPHQPFAGPQALTADQSPTQPLWCVQRSRSQNHTAVYPSKHLSPFQVAPVPAIVGLKFVSQMPLSLSGELPWKQRHSLQSWVSNFVRCSPVHSANFANLHGHACVWYRWLI